MEVSVRNDLVTLRRSRPKPFAEPRIILYVPAFVMIRNHEQRKRSRPEPTQILHDAGASSEGKR